MGGQEAAAPCPLVRPQPRCHRLHILCFRLRRTLICLAAPPLQIGPIALGSDLVYIFVLICGLILRVDHLTPVIRGEPDPQRTQGGRQPKAEQAPLFRRQVDGLIRRHLIDVAEGHGQPGCHYPVRAQETGHVNALRRKNLGRLHPLGVQPPAGDADGLQIIHSDAVGGHSARLHEAPASDGLGLEAAGDGQAAVHHQMPGG